MAMKKFPAYVSFQEAALRLPVSAFRVYWILCKYRDNRTGTAYVSPTLARLSWRQLRRILILLQNQRLIGKTFGGRFVIDVENSKRVRATFWDDMPTLGELRFKAALALILGPKSGLSAEGMREAIACRKGDACRLLRDLMDQAPIFLAKAAVSGSRMSTPKPAISLNSGSALSALSTSVENKKRTPSKPMDFFAVAKYKEFLLSGEDIDQAIRLYLEARRSQELLPYADPELANGVLYAFIASKEKAKNFGAYFFACLRRNLLTGYCPLDSVRRRQQVTAEMAVWKRKEEEERKAAEAAAAVEEGIKAVAMAMFPVFLQTPIWCLGGPEIAKINPEYERMYEAAKSAYEGKKALAVFA